MSSGRYGINVPDVQHYDLFDEADCCGRYGINVSDYSVISCSTRQTVSGSKCGVRVLYISC